MAGLVLAFIRKLAGKAIKACSAQPVVCAKTANRFVDWLVNLLRR